MPDIELLQIAALFPVLLGASMIPVGLMLGSSCSACCEGAICQLNSSTPSFPTVNENYACDNEQPRATTTLGVSGSATLLPAYFDVSRVRGTSSLAKSLSCENICDLASYSPSYIFAGNIPAVSVTLSFSGNAVEIKHYYSKFKTSDTTLYNNCFRHTTISRTTGTYVLTHQGGGIFRYATTTAFGSDLFDITASLHRCNDVAMWLLSVAFVSRTVQNKCELSIGSSPDTSVCNSTSMPGGGSEKTLRCCVGHVLHYATACIRTGGVFSDRLDCGSSTPATISLDASNASALSVSGTLSVNQRVVTSGNDNTFGNPYNRIGLNLRETDQQFGYAGLSAGCFCRDQVNTFKDAMPFATSYGGAFSIDVS